VRIDGAAPAPGTILSLDGKEAGEMRSSRDSIGLALLRLDAVADDRSLAAEGATLAAMRPDWMRIEQGQGE
jgi:tRNA-modifying protein YgfZ